MNENTQIRTALEHTLKWSANSGYRGWNKHDGLNSPLLRLLLGWGRWPRMLAIQGVMRFPVNLRPLLLVPKVYNPKGLALFAQARLDLWRAEGEESNLQEVQRLLALLRELCSPGDWGGICWGYHYPWQDPGFFAPTNTPNAVVTAFVCEAFLDAYRATGEAQYLETVGSAIGFFTRDLKVLKREPGELCLGYMPLPMTMRVMDVSILIGSLMAQYAAHTDDARIRNTARDLVNYVVKRQTEEGAWFYTDPPTDSHIRHDNYHTGFILDALRRYMEATGERHWEESYRKGLDFYAGHLFNIDGSPRWMSDQDYPHDIHGAAQGILTFSRHLESHPGLAEKIAEWVLANMYHPEGRFYYQQARSFTKRFTLLRWCNGWMVRALAHFLAMSSAPSAPENPRNPIFPVVQDEPS